MALWISYGQVQFEDQLLLATVYKWPTVVWEVRTFLTGHSLDVWTD